MYRCYTLRLASSGRTGVGFALCRLGGRSGCGRSGASPVVPAARSRTSVSATPHAAVPTLGVGEQGVAMEPDNKQLHQQPPQAPPPRRGGDDAAADAEDQEQHRRDAMTHSFGEGYSSRSDEEGFGGVYRKDDPVFRHGAQVHPSHPDYDATQGSEVKEKEKARHLKDDKHAT
ncbi:hypothetical protein GUJ93_ZPchr0003g18164 [Zizania palustris]|uniref:Uncharacterized protein n=1 Tax=Zizania palustris TaxID=103762 RepID=A0A8J5SBW5_ZIZPA|nr:hypothetical protein GUJ93_ZPchr0003g18164 [Zizania palustris]